MKKKYILFLFLFFILSCKNLNKINLSFYYKDTHNTEVFLDEKIKNFTENNPNIQIHINKKSKEELLTDFEKNKKKIDFIRYPSNYISEFTDKKLLKSCNDIFEKSLINKISDNALQTSTINDPLWGIPDNYINYPIMYYNKSVIKNPPKNTSELIKINNQLKYRYNNLGIYINLKEPFFIYPWFNGFGVDFFNNESTVPNINQKQVIDDQSHHNNKNIYDQTFQKILS